MKQIVIDSNLVKESRVALWQRFSNSDLSMEEARTLMRMIQIFKESVEVRSSGKMSLTSITLNTLE